MKLKLKKDSIFAGLTNKKVNAGDESSKENEGELNKEGINYGEGADRNEGTVKAAKGIHRLNSDKGGQERLPLRVKLSLSHILIAAIPILITVVIITSQASSSLLTKVNNSNLAYATQVTEMIDSNIASIENLVTIIMYNTSLNATVSKNREDYDKSYDMMQERKENFDSVILSLQSSNSNIRKIFLVKENEIIGSAPDAKQKDFVDQCIETYTAGDTSKAKKRVWFYDNDNIYILKDLFNIKTSKYVGVLVVQVDKKIFSDNINNSFGGDAKIALLDSQGQTIVAPKDQEEMGEIKYFNSLKSKIDEKEESSGMFTTKEGVKEEMSILYGSTSNQWIYLMQIPVNQILGDISKLKTVSTVLAAITIVAAALIGVWISLSISKPIDYIRRKLKQVEQGDLTVRSEIEGKYEIGQLSQSFNHMTLNMRELLQKVDSAAGKVSSNSNELQRIAENSADASSEIVQAVESITLGAEEQAKESEEAAIVVKELVELFHTAESDFHEVVKATDSTKEASNNASSTMENLTAATNSANELTQNIRTSIKKLGERIHEISGIIELINNISKQTNLLALNASIEAARVGEAGKGFAVVANEVNKLAAQSSDSVKSITSIIDNIITEVTQTETMIEEGSSIYVKQGGAVNDTEVIFKDVARNMDTISEKVTSVYGIMERIDQVKDKASDAITGIAAIAEEAAAATEEVLARGEEQTVTAEQLKNMSLELSEVITQMREQMRSFSI